jgi:uncharacterized protein with FMN-binding domain
MDGKEMSNSGSNDGPGQPLQNPGQRPAKTPANKVANSLVAISGAAVLAVYSAGFLRTRAAANRFELMAADRMPARSGYEKYRGSSNGLPPSVGSPGAAPAASEPSRELPHMPKPPGPPPLESSLKTSSPAPQSDRAEVIAPAPEPTVEPSATPPVAAEVTLAKQPVPAPSPATASFAAPFAAPAVPLLAPAANASLAAPAKNTWKDGTYYGWGTSRHGDIQAAVVIEGGRIASATIAQCRTRYSCSVIDKLPPEVAQRQSPDVDYVSGATQSANAFYFAVVEALGQAK